MPAGMIVRDPSGRIQVDLTTRVTKYVFSLTLPNTNGAETLVSLPALVPGEFFLVSDESTIYRTGPFFQIQSGSLRYSWRGNRSILVHFYRF